MTDTPAAPAPADLTAEQIYAMTPAEAGAALAAMDRAIHPPPSVVPQDAQDARATLDLLSRDASFARELFSGSMLKRASGSTNSWPSLLPVMMLAMLSPGLLNPHCR